MTAKSSKGLTICISKGAATPLSTVPTAITDVKPAVVTFTTLPVGIAAGDIVVPKNTGQSSVDGKPWIVGPLTPAGKTITLLGSDNSGGTTTIAAGAKIESYATTDMECLCLSNLSMSVDDPGTVDVGTYCDPSASIPSAAGSAGTIEFAGFVNIADADYQELLTAADDGILRYLRITLPSNGYFIAPATFSSITWDLPLDGAIGYSGTAVLGSKLRHVF
jgi:hypothetical protein